MLTVLNRALVLILLLHRAGTFRRLYRLCCGVALLSVRMAARLLGR